MKRAKTKKIMVGEVPVGGDSPISVQSMTNTDTSDIKKTVDQIKSLEEAGCDIIRLAVNNLEDAKALEKIKSQISIPLISDVQFDYRLGIWSVENGCDCLRINPGNIGGEESIDKIVDVCKRYQVPIRIGVNTGSLHQDMIDKYGGVNVNSLVYSALEEVRLLEERDFTEIKISIKSSDVIETIEAYKKISSLCDYPLHLGITEAGPPFRGTIKSSIGIGSLLYQGIGDTIRVSLTGDPVEEVKVGREILRSLGLLEDGVQLISCPTCSRTKIDLIALVEEADKLISKIDKNITVAIMGCPVNGPGEAKEADLGIAGGNGMGIIFKRGKVIKKVKEEDLLSSLLEEIERY